jgi:hypothetical protein
VGAASVAIFRVSHDGMNRTALGPTRLSIIAATPLTRRATDYADLRTSATDLW